MNKELIKKYKKGFDHWLNDRKLLYKHCDTADWKAVTERNKWGEPELLYVINDEYVEFRRALAEGKVVEFSTSRHLEDIWHTLETPMFNEDYKYRIKPDEPKLKTGDWVTQNSSEPFQFTEDTCFLGLELWQPQPGEHIWDNTYGLSVVENVSLEEGVLCRECFNGKVLFTPTMKEVEPFIGILPSFPQD